MELEKGKWKMGKPNVKKGKVKGTM